MVVEAFEKSYVSRLIEKHGGNVTRAAREAQKDRRAFGRLLKKHGIRGGSSPT
jgi:DNA-binding NtrC family response regulator